MKALPPGSMGGTTMPKRIYITAFSLAVFLGMITILAVLQVRSSQTKVVLTFGDVPQDCRMATPSPIRLQETRTVKIVNHDNKEVEVYGLLYVACVDKTNAVPQSEIDASFSWGDENVYQLDPNVVITSDELKCVAAEAARTHIDNFPAYKGHAAIYVGTFPITENFQEKCE